MGILVWITGIVGALGFAMSGMMKLIGHEMAVDVLTRVGADDKRMLIGGAEVAGGLGLLIGAISSPGDGEWIGVLAAIGLIITMVLAVQAHLKAAEEMKESVPAIMMGMIAIVYVIALMGNN
jgi:hypothetical protein